MKHRYDFGFRDDSDENYPVTVSFNGNSLEEAWALSNSLIPGKKFAVYNISEYQPEGIDPVINFFFISSPTDKNSLQAVVSVYAGSEKEAVMKAEQISGVPDLSLQSVTKHSEQGLGVVSGQVQYSGIAYKDGDKEKGITFIVEAKGYEEAIKTVSFLISGAEVMITSAYVRDM